jgi:site-specific recombinase XerC
VGAFLVGLSLNRLIPEQSLLSNRIRFIGESIFIPFFLLSIGMLVDVRVLVADARAWQVMLGMTITVTFTKWLAAEGELEADPTVGMHAPHVPEEPVPVLSDDQLRALLAACKGTGFAERRDTAIIRLFVDTGMRLGEMAGLQVADLDMDLEVATVIGKGRRARSCPFGATTGQALDRYLRVRSRHGHAGLDALWIGKYGPMTTSGIRQMLTRRGQAAGSADNQKRINPSRIRETARPRGPPRRR